MAFPGKKRFEQSSPKYAHLFPIREGNGHLGAELFSRLYGAVLTVHRLT